MNLSTLSLIVKAIVVMMVMNIALGSFAVSDSGHTGSARSSSAHANAAQADAAQAVLVALAGSAHANSVHQKALRGMIANKMKVMSEASSAESMYVAGTAPFCDGVCNNGDVTLVGSLLGEYWSGNKDAYGDDCWAGSKALCLTSSGGSGSLWSFPMCEPQGICTVEKGCTGCPTGTQQSGAWPETNGVQCCSAEEYIGSVPVCISVYAAVSCSVTSS
jgi:hypothetical protein